MDSIGDTPQGCARLFGVLTLGYHIAPLRGLRRFAAEMPLHGKKAKAVFVPMDVAHEL